MGGPARQPAGWSLRRGPRTAGEKGRSCTEGPRATDSPVTRSPALELQPGAGPGSGGPQGRLGNRRSTPPPPWLAWLQRLWSWVDEWGETGGITAYQAPHRDSPLSPRCGRGQGVDASPNIRGIPIISKTLPVSVSALPTLLPSTSHFPLGNVKVQNAETWANSSLETCSGAAQAFSRPVHPRSQRPDQRKVRAQGLPPSMGCARLARAVSAEAGEAGGRTDVHRSCTAGRSSLHSAMASFARGSSGRFWRAGGAAASLGLHLGIESPAGPEGRAGLPSLPGTSIARGGLSARQASLLAPASGPPTFPGNQPTLSRPANLRHLSVTCACLLGQGPIPGRKGSSIPQRPPCCPQPRPLGPCPGVGWRGREEGTAPGAESTPRGSPAPPKQMGASRAHEKYQQHEAPAGPL